MEQEGKCGRTNGTARGPRKDHRCGPKGPFLSSTNRNDFPDDKQLAPFSFVHLPGEDLPLPTPPPRNIPNSLPGKNRPRVVFLAKGGKQGGTVYHVESKPEQPAPAGGLLAESLARDDTETYKEPPLMNATWPLVHSSFNEIQDSETDTSTNNSPVLFSSDSSRLWNDCSSRQLLQHCQNKDKLRLNRTASDTSILFRRIARSPTTSSSGFGFARREKELTSLVANNVCDELGPHSVSVGSLVGKLGKNEDRHIIRLASSLEGEDGENGARNVQVNNDALLGKPAGRCKNKGMLDAQRLSVFAVIDGHGGGGCADYIQAQLPKALLQCLVGLPSTAAPASHPVEEEEQPGAVPALLELLAERLIARLEAGFMEQAHEHEDTSGACLALALCHGDHVAVANVGDCLALFCGAGGAAPRLLSEAHRVARPAEAARLAARGVPAGQLAGGRLAGCLGPSRALGDLDVKRALPLDAQPFVASVEVRVPVKKYAAGSSSPGIAGASSPPASLEEGPESFSLVDEVGGIAPLPRKPSRYGSLARSLSSSLSPKGGGGRRSPPTDGLSSPPTCKKYAGSSSPGIAGASPPASFDEWPESFSLVDEVGGTPPSPRKPSRYGSLARSLSSSLSPKGGGGGRRSFSPLPPGPWRRSPPREAGRPFLLLGTDGLWDGLTAAAAARAIRKALASAGGGGGGGRVAAAAPAGLAQALAERARAAGSRDDVAVVLVVF